MDLSVDLVVQHLILFIKLQIALIFLSPFLDRELRNRNELGLGLLLFLILIIAVIGDIGRILIGRFAAHDPVDFVKHAHVLLFKCSLPVLILLGVQKKRDKLLFGGFFRRLQHLVIIGFLILRPHRTHLGLQHKVHVYRLILRNLDMIQYLDIVTEADLLIVQIMQRIVQADLGLYITVNGNGDLESVFLQFHQRKLHLITGLRFTAAAENIIDLLPQKILLLCKGFQLFKGFLRILQVFSGKFIHLFLRQPLKEAVQKGSGVSIHRGSGKCQDPFHLFRTQFGRISVVQDRGLFIIDHEIPGMHIAMIKAVAEDTLADPQIRCLFEMIPSLCDGLQILDQVVSGLRELVDVLGIQNKLVQDFLFPCVLVHFGHPEGLFGKFPIFGDLFQVTIHRFSFRLVQDKVAFLRWNLFHHMDRSADTRDMIQLLFIDLNAISAVLCFRSQVQLFLHLGKLSLVSREHPFTGSFCTFLHDRCFSVDTFFSIRPEQFDHDLLPFRKIGSIHAAEQCLSDRSCAKRLEFFDLCDLLPAVFDHLVKHLVDLAVRNRLQFGFHVLDRVTEFLHQIAARYALHHFLYERSCSAKQSGKMHSRLFQRICLHMLMILDRRLQIAQHCRHHGLLISCGHFGEIILHHIPDKSAFSRTILAGGILRPVLMVKCLQGEFFCFYVLVKACEGEQITCLFHEKCFRSDNIHLKLFTVNDLLIACRPLLRVLHVLHFFQRVVRFLLDLLCPLLIRLFIRLIILMAIIGLIFGDFTSGVKPDLAPERFHFLVQILKHVVGDFPDLLDNLLICFIHRFEDLSVCLRQKRHQLRILLLQEFSDMIEFDAFFPGLLHQIVHDTGKMDADLLRKGLVRSFHSAAHGFKDMQRNFRILLQLLKFRLLCFDGLLQFFCLRLPQFFLFRSVFLFLFFAVLQIIDLLCDLFQISVALVDLRLVIQLLCLRTRLLDLFHLPEVIMQLFVHHQIRNVYGLFQKFCICFVIALQFLLPCLDLLIPCIQMGKILQFFHILLLMGIPVALLRFDGVRLFLVHFDLAFQIIHIVPVRFFLLRRLVKAHLKFLNGCFFLFQDTVQVLPDLDLLFQLQIAFPLLNRLFRLRRHICQDFYMVFKQDKEIRRAFFPLLLHRCEVSHEVQGVLFLDTPFLLYLFFFSFESSLVVKIDDGQDLIRAHVLLQFLERQFL